MTESVLRIIVDSGIYDLPAMTNAQTKTIESPCLSLQRHCLPEKSSRLTIVFLSRHDNGHRLSPSEINYNANIDALKRANLIDLVSLSACGSFKEEFPFMKPIRWHVSDLDQAWREKLRGNRSDDRTHSRRLSLCRTGYPSSIPEISQCDRSPSTGRSLFRLHQLVPAAVVAVIIKAPVGRPEARASLSSSVQRRLQIR
jgi:hypothetical protein